MVAEVVCSPFYRSTQVHLLKKDTPVLELEIDGAVVPPEGTDERKVFDFFTQGPWELGGESKISGKEGTIHSIKYERVSSSNDRITVVIV